jgi:predicted esterase
MVLHETQPLRWAGLPPHEARAALVLLHGRGGSADDMLALAQPWNRLPGWTQVALQAAGHTWYPFRFMAPLAQNEPWLTSALQAVAAAVARLETHGIAPERTVLLGFSQGACLALEFAARHARRYGGVVGLSGGLIGPDGLERQDAGTLDGTPVFLGCSDDDPHIPVHRVHHAASVLAVLGGTVTTRLYPGWGHTVHPDALAAVDDLLQQVAHPSPTSLNP